MIKVTVMYPNTTDVKFDADYYKNKHLPMVANLTGKALKKMELDLGIGSRIPGEPAPYIAIAHLYFDDIASFQNSFGMHAKTFAEDVKNYTNIKAELQISELIEF